MAKIGLFLNPSAKNGDFWTHYRGGGPLGIGTKISLSGPFLELKNENCPKCLKFWAGKVPAERRYQLEDGSQSEKTLFQNVKNDVKIGNVTDVTPLCDK